MGLAPTTSTTVMLALGDALSVALLERKGFSSDDFHVLHPGGKLGRRLLHEAEGEVVVRLDGYRTIPLPGPVPAAAAAALHTTFRR